MVTRFAFGAIKSARSRINRPLGRHIPLAPVLTEEGLHEYALRMFSFRMGTQRQEEGVGGGER